MADAVIVTLKNGKQFETTRNALANGKRFWDIAKIEPLKKVADTSEEDAPKVDVKSVPASAEEVETETVEEPPKVEKEFDSSEHTVKELAKMINDTDDVFEIRELVKGDKRKGVIKAAEERINALTEGDDK